MVAAAKPGGRRAPAPRMDFGVEPVVEKDDLPQVNGFSRREFLARTGRVALGTAALATLPPWARAAIAADETNPDIISHSSDPENWETTLEALDRAWLTRNDRFFVRSHFPVPTVQLDNYRLEVVGEVHEPLSLTLADLLQLPQREAPYTLECAGNGRANFGTADPSQQPSRLLGIPLLFGAGRSNDEEKPQWRYGAVGNARWGGVRLSTILDRAGLTPNAEHVWFEAADSGQGKGPDRFLRSIPMRKALGDVLLAHRMNGERLPVYHGAPLRAIVPGWYAMASTKWVTRIRVESRPSNDHFMRKDYHLEGPGLGRTPLEEMAVKSIITAPLDGARIETGLVRFQGFTWAGKAGVRMVQISIDDGKNWQYAGFMGDRYPNAWRRWATEIEFERPGDYTVMARATDGRGNEQPLEPVPNRGGYANNAIQKVSFTLFGEPKKDDEG